MEGLCRGRRVQLWQWIDREWVHAVCGDEDPRVRDDPALRIFGIRDCRDFERTDVAFQAALQNKEESGGWRYVRTAASFY